MKTPKKRRIWIIDTGTSGEMIESKTAFGPFDSIKAAEHWLREDAKDTYISAGPDLRYEWSSDPMIILEEIRTVMQKPIVNVRVVLSECKNSNKSGGEK